jgi:hypothetical protein
MSAISVVGRINEVGELELEKLPALRPGKVQVTIRELVDAEMPWEDRPWTPEEIKALMESKPKTGAEIAAMILSGEVDTSVWAEMDIPDSVEWLKNLRRQDRKQRGLE